jgi:hypothetical protein
MTECVTCGHSIPLADTYCGGDECLNRYAADNEHSEYSYQQYQAWLSERTATSPALDYHDWAKAHVELAELLAGDIDHHDQDDIDALREYLNLATA